MSPMTTWLRGGRNRRCVLKPTSLQMSGVSVRAELWEQNKPLAIGDGAVVEEAMANALNALFAAQGVQS